MPVAMETAVDFGYGPHPGYPALPVSMAMRGVPDADHIQYRLESPWQQPWQPAFFYPDLQYINDIFLDYKFLLCH